MFHVVLLSVSKKEFWKICDGVKTMIAYSSNADRPKYRNIKKGHELYFLEDSGKGIVKAKAVVSDVIILENADCENNSEIVNEYQKDLQMSRTEIKHLLNKNKVFMIQFDNFELISPLIYLNSDKIKDVSSYNDNYDEILKPIK